MEYSGLDIQLSFSMTNILHAQSRFVKTIFETHLCQAVIFA